MLNPKNTILALALTVGTMAATASNTNSALMQMAEEARNARREAMEISRMLKDKTPDFAQVSQKVEVLSRHTEQLRAHIQAFEATQISLSAPKLEEFRKVRVGAEVLNIFVQNKTELLATDAVRHRNLLRAKADGIAKRAGMVEETVTRLRG